MMTGYISTHQRMIGSNEVDVVLAANKGDYEAFNQLVLRYQDSCTFYQWFIST